MCITQPRTLFLKYKTLTSLPKDKLIQHAGGCLDQSSGHTELTERTTVKVAMKLFFSEVCAFKVNKKVRQNRFSLLVYEYFAKHTDPICKMENLEQDTGAM